MAKDFYISLIYKELDGSITAVEQHKLDDWSSDPANRVLKRQISSVWNLSESYEEPVSVDLDLDFAEIQSKINTGIKAKSITSPSRSNNWMSIAAGAAILIATIFGIQHFTKVSSELVSHIATKSNQYYLLEDGSEIYLQKGAMISYNQPLDKDRRVINLVGEGVFNVAHDKNWPLDVKTATETITVLGTKFHVISNEANSFIQLIEGQIEVSDTNGKLVMRLKPGQSLNRNHSIGQNDLNSNLNDNDFAWQSNRLIFRNAGIDDVVKDLQKHYGVTIKLDNEAYKQCRLTATFEEKSIDQVMNVISEIHGITVEKNDNEIRWKGGKCE